MNRRTGFMRARRNIEYHYDLGNDLFALFLDETMTYSCAIFERDDEPLEDAQLRKLRRVCEKLELGPGDHVLEIGCGWGSFATVAAGEYGARVTGITISPAQAEMARERIAAAGLADRVRVLEQDYRTVEGRFTKIASIEMLEAIGEKQFETYFAACDRLLAPGGRACIQTILVPDARYDRYRKTPDWIERYVFPGCLIPSLGALTQAMKATRLQVARPRGDRPELRRDAPPLAHPLRRAARGGRAARLRRALPPHLGLLPRLLRGGLRDALAPRRAADIEPGVNLYTIFDAIGIRELLRRVYRIEVEGGEHIPAAGPAVLAANHESLADPFFLGVATTRPIHYMAKAELWRNPIVGG